MSACEHCLTALPDDLSRCEDARACSRRAAKRLNKRLHGMITKRFLGFDPDAAYREAVKGPDRPSARTEKVA